MAGEESIFDFSDVPLAFDESTFELLDVTLARKDNRPRAPDQAEDSRSTYPAQLARAALPQARSKRANTYKNMRAIKFCPMKLLSNNNKIPELRIKI